MQGKSVSVFLIVVALLVSASALEAQIIPQIQFEKIPRTLNVESTLPIQFTLAPPGARSLGMGGAFIAIADDATASESNPAGLTILTRPEFSFHVRDYSFDGTVDDPKAAIAFGVANVVRADESDPNRLVPRPNPRCGGPAGPPCTPIDETQSQRRVRDSSTDLSFFSYVKPLPKWVFSVYYNRFANFSSSTSLDFTDTIFLDDYFGRASSDIVAESIGVSGAFKITKRLAFGASVRLTQIDVDNSDTFRIEDFSDLELENFIFADFSFQPRPEEVTDILRADRNARGDDSEITYNLGLLWDANQKVSAGLVLKKGGDFDIDTQTFFFDCISFEGVTDAARRANLLRIFDIPGGASTPCNAGSVTGDFVSPNPFSVPGGVRGTETITIPDLLGFGLAFRPNERLTLALDLNYITYSDLDPPRIFLTTRVPGQRGAPVTEPDRKSVV